MAEGIFPLYSPTAKKGDKGMRMVDDIVSDQLNWILRPQEDQKDLGIDAHIEVLGDSGEAYGKLLAAQVKCGKSFFRTSNSEGYVFYGERKHLNYYINYSLPVILILCDPDENKCWWSEINPLETERTGTGWQITVPFDQSFDLTAKEILAKLAGPAQDYHKEMDHYWQVNELLTMPKAFSVIVIGREDIEAKDTKRVLSILERFRASKKVARENRENIVVSVNGYEDDIRELFEIPEVRMWFKQICNEFPYWFYFLSTELESLKLIVFSISPYTILSRGQKPSMVQVDIDTTGLGPFLRSNYGGLNEMCSFVGLGEDVIYSISRSVSSVIFPEFDYPPIEQS